MIRDDQITGKSGPHVLTLYVDPIVTSGCYVAVYESERLREIAWFPWANMRRFGEWMIEMSEKYEEDEAREE